MPIDKNKRELKRGDFIKVKPDNYGQTVIGTIVNLDNDTNEHGTISYPDKGGSYVRGTFTSADGELVLRKNGDEPEPLPEVSQDAKAKTPKPTKA